MYITIRPKIRVVIDLIVSFPHDHSTKIYDLLSFILHLCTTIRTKIRVLIDLLPLFAYDHSTNLYDDRLSFFLSLCTTILSKIRVLITLLFCLYTTTIWPKLGRGSLLVFNLFFPYCQYVLCYIYGSTAPIFLTVCFSQYCLYISSTTFTPVLPLYFFH